MDVVYLVREGDNNEELRYSLRSLVNIPHEKVFISGYMPSWVRNVTNIKRKNSLGSKYLNSTANLIKACSDPRVSDNFILMNDDFFILRPMESVPVYHRGPVKDIIEEYTSRERPDKPYIAGMQATYDLLQEHHIREPLSYELHVPMVINKQRFLQVYEVGRHLPVLHKRTLYGNLNLIGGEQMADVKITRRNRDQERHDTFLSTDENDFLLLGQHSKLKKLFPKTGPYEKG